MENAIIVEQQPEVVVNKPTGRRSFRSSAEVEAFFRFIHEHNLRYEAKRMLEVVIEKVAPPKKSRRQKNLQ